MKYDNNELKPVLTCGESKLTNNNRSQSYDQQQQQQVVVSSQGSTVNSGKECLTNNCSIDDNLQFNGTNGLPRKFVDALRSLFSLLDESKAGFIKLSELEMRWKTIEHESNVPKGLIECLQSFQISHDCIDFDRFCHAIAVCISRDTTSNLSSPSSPHHHHHHPGSSSSSSSSTQAIPASSLTIPITTPPLPPPTTAAYTTSSSSLSTGNNEIKGAAGNPGTSNFPPTASEIFTSPINSNHNDLIGVKLGLERTTFNSDLMRNAAASTTTFTDESVNLLSSELYQPFPGDHLLQENVPTTLKPSSSSAFTLTSLPSGVTTFTTSSVTTGTTLTSTTAKTSSSCEDICNDEAHPPNTNHRPSDFRSDYRVVSMPQLRETRPPVINCDQPGTSSETNLVGSTAFRQYNSDAKIGFDGKTQRVPMRNRIINILKEWKNNAIHRSKNPPLPPSVALGPGTSIAPNLASNITSTLDKCAPSTSNINNNNTNGTDSTSPTTQPKMLQDDDDWGFSSNFGLPNNNSARTRHGKRREARRHTITTGIDINTIKRLQQYEQEKEILLQGLEMVERGRDWYMKSINNIQNKIRFIGQTIINPGDYSLDANQERINFQATRILTVNQHLAALMDNLRGFPVHMNLALRPLLTNNTSNNLVRPQYLDGRSNDPSSTNVTVQRLKEQNRLLTEEVSMKSDKITILEREKSALIRELFQSRSNSTQKTTDDTDDNTFM